MLKNEIELTYQDFIMDFYIQTDVSEAVVGAHLYQIDNNNKVKTIAFMSKTMQASELNYTVTEKELLAIIYAVKKFYSIIAGYKTKICTDHKALIFLNLCKNPTPRIIKWLLYLQPLKLDFEHIEGTNNCVADALSKNPIERDEVNVKDKIFNINNLSNKEFTEFIKEIKVKQKEDQFGKEHIFLKSKDNLQILIVDEIIYRKQGEKWLVIVPKTLIKTLIQKTHEIKKES